LKLCPKLWICVLATLIRGWTAGVNVIHLPCNEFIYTSVDSKATLSRFQHYFDLRWICYTTFFLQLCSSLQDFDWHSASRRPSAVAEFLTARCYASAVLAMGLCPSVSVSVRLSVTSRSSTETAKHRITQTTPRDSPGSLVFWRQRSPRNSTGITPYEGAECRWGGSKSATFDK